jgi:hypothetical protein
VPGVVVAAEIHAVWGSNHTSRLVHYYVKFVHMRLSIHFAQYMLCHAMVGKRQVGGLVLAGIIGCRRGWWWDMDGGLAVRRGR